MVDWRRLCSYVLEYECYRMLAASCGSTSSDNNSSVFAVIIAPGAFDECCSPCPSPSCVRDAVSRLSKFPTCPTLHSPIYHVCQIQPSPRAAAAPPARNTENLVTGAAVKASHLPSVVRTTTLHLAMVTPLFLPVSCFDRRRMPSKVDGGFARSMRTGRRGLILAGALRSVQHKRCQPRNKPLCSAV